MIDNKQRTTLPFGGRSDEHDVSVLSAPKILPALEPGTSEPVPVYSDEMVAVGASMLPRHHSHAQIAMQPSEYDTIHLVFLPILETRDRPIWHNLRTENGAEGATGPAIR
jgi:D-alanine-D-alanine ligase-like ATP-grasp enzyme